MREKTNNFFFFSCFFFVLVFDCSKWFLQRIVKRIKFPLGTESCTASFGHVDIGQKKFNSVGKTASHCNSSTYGNGYSHHKCSFLQSSGFPVLIFLLPVFVSFSARVCVCTRTFYPVFLLFF